MLRPALGGRVGFALHPSFVEGTPRAACPLAHLLQWFLSSGACHFLLPFLERKGLCLAQLRR